MRFSQLTTQFDEPPFKSLSICLFLFLRAVEITLVVCLRIGFKPLSHFTSQYWHGCYR